MKPIFYIGIDPGTKTGIAVWNTRQKFFRLIMTAGVIKAMKEVELFKNDGIQVILEDATQVKFKTDPRKAQGAGSIKRDVAVWKEFFEEHGIQYRLVRPNKLITKWSSEKFKQATGFTGRTDQHARDAAMLVYGM